MNRRAGTLKRNDVALSYELSGDGPPVLLIQGVGVVGECWRPQVNALENFQTLIFDNRGIGNSQPCTGPISLETMASDARALMDAAGWESAHVVGVTTSHRSMSARFQRMPAFHSSHLTTVTSCNQP